MHQEALREPRKTAKRASKSAAAPKTLSWNIRVDAETQCLVDRAASALNQTRTEFMLSSAKHAATEVLLNQTLFVLGEPDWNAFVHALDNPQPPNAKLKALLRCKAPWEKTKE